MTYIVTLRIQSGKFSGLRESIILIFLRRVRFLGYAGVPFIISLPCTFYSGKSLVRMWKTNGGIKKSTNKSLVFESVGNAPSLPLQSFKQGSVNILLREQDLDPKSTNSLGRQSPWMRATPVSGMTTTHSFVTANEELPSPSPSTSSSPLPFMPTSRSPVDKNFHMPFKPRPAPLDLLIGERGTARGEEKEDFSSDISSTFPVFAPTKAATTGKRRKDDAIGVLDFPDSGENDKTGLNANGMFGGTVSSRRYTAPMAQSSERAGEQ